MNRSTFLAVIAGIALVFSILLFAVRNGESSRSAGNDNRELLSAIDRVAATQAELSQRMDRLEYRLGTSGGAPGRAGMGVPNYPAVLAGKDPNGRNLSPADRDAMLASSLHVLDDQLVRDPISPQWASANEQAIGNFLSRENLSRQQLPVPKNSKTECHSHLCKISMTYADEAQASQTESMMLAEIGAKLPQAQTLVLPQPDGSVQMIVFAGDSNAFGHP